MKLKLKIYLKPVTAFWMIAPSLLLSNTKDNAATVEPQVKVNSSWSNEPAGACVNTPSLVPPLRNKTCQTINYTEHNYNGYFYNALKHCLHFTSSRVAVRV